MHNSAKTYLVMRFQSLGNVAMLIPVLSSVAAENPESQFVVLTQGRLKDLFFGMENVHVWNVEQDPDSDKKKSAWQVYSELKQAYKITHVVDLQKNSWSEMLDFLFRMSGKRVTKLHSDSLAKQRLCRKGYSACEPLRTEFERYAETFRRAGLRCEVSFTAVPENPVAKALVRERFGEKHGTMIGIAPFAKSKTNMIPYRISKEVIARFSQRKDTKVYLFGAGRVECEMLNQWAELFDNVENVAGKVSIAEELELMRGLDLMLCMDSANQHLASLVGLRCLSVWCGTHPYSGFSGWNQSKDDILQQPWSCRPCTMHGRNKCKYRNFLCRNFTSAEIIDRMEQILKA